jgi:outer membrane murein-binding lipoprotein Lpp
LYYGTKQNVSHVIIESTMEYPASSRVFLFLFLISTLSPQCCHGMGFARKFDEARVTQCESEKTTLLAQVDQLQALGQKYPTLATVSSESKEVLKTRANLKNLCISEEQENKKYVELDQRFNEISEEMDQQEGIEMDVNSTKEEKKQAKAKFEALRTQTKEIKEGLDEASAEAIELEAQERFTFDGTESDSDDYTSVTAEMRSLPERLDKALKGMKQLSKEEKVLLGVAKWNALQVIRGYDLGKDIKEIDIKLSQLIRERSAMNRKIEAEKKSNKIFKKFRYALKMKSVATVKAEQQQKIERLGGDLGAMEAQISSLIELLGKYHQEREEAIWPSRFQDDTPKIKVKEPKGPLPDISHILPEMAEQLKEPEPKQKAQKASPVKKSGRRRRG